MGNSIIDFGRIIKRTGVRINNEQVAQHGFFILQGIFAGIALNDIWRILNLPGNNTPLSIAGVPSTMHQDYLWQLGFAALSAGAEVLGGVEHGIAFATGIFLGSTWANHSEAGNYIGNITGVPKTQQWAPTPQPPVVLQPSYMPIAISTPNPGVALPSVTGAPYNPMANAAINAPHIGYNLP